MYPCSEPNTIATIFQEVGWLQLHIYLQQSPLLQKTQLEEASCSLLSHLEVQCLDAVGIHEGKENPKTNQNYSNWRHEVWIITKMVLYIPLNGWIR